MIAHNSPLNSLANVEECKNESGSDASSNKASARIIEQPSMHVTVQSLAGAKSVFKEEQKVEKIIILSNQSIEATAKMRNLSSEEISDKDDDSILIRIEAKKEEMAENKEPTIDFSRWRLDPLVGPQELAFL